MKTSIKSILKIFALVSILIIFFICLSRFVFTGVFEKKYTQEEVKENFIHHEKDFLDLVTYFDSIVPENKQRVTFGLGENDNQITLSIYPLDGSISKTNPIIGGSNLELRSLKADSAILALGWSNLTVMTLKDKLSKTNCEWIRTDTDHKSIDVFFKRSGFGSYSYNVFEESLPDSSIQIYGKPINKSGFGRRVIISYSTAL